MRRIPWRTCSYQFALASLAALVPQGSPTWAQCDPGSLFSVGGTYSAGPRPRFVVAADFNSDAALDLAVSNSAIGANTITILLGSGDGTFHSGGAFDAGGPALGLVSRDFNGDGVPDLAVANGDAGVVSILPGQGAGGVGDGTFGPPSSFEAGAAPELLCARDFNADGILDLAVADRGTKWIRVLVGQGSGGVGDGVFAQGFSTFIPYSPTSLTAADLDRDGIADLLIGTVSQPRLAVMVGSGSNGAGNGAFAPPVYYSAGPAPSDVTVQDFNADGRWDVAVSNRSGGGAYVLLGLPSGGLGTAVPFGSGSSFSSLAALDVDDDAIVDLLATTSPGDQLVLLKGNGAGGKGNGAFAAPVVEAGVGPSPSDLVVAVFDGDCAADVVVTSQNDLAGPPSNLSILLGRCALTTCGRAPNLLSARDVPEDEGGRVHLVWQSSPIEGMSVSGYEIRRRALDGPGEWIRVHEMAARGDLIYSTDAPTSRDSVAGDPADHEFLVRAVTPDPNVHFDSRILSARSVDDRSPPAPSFFGLDWDPAGAIVLRWSRSIASDLLEYRLYRGPVPTFAPGPHNLIAVVHDTTHVDPAGSPASVYKLSAVDVHGNESAPRLPTVNGACPAPSNALSARVAGGLFRWQPEATQYDTSFSTSFSDYRAAYNLSEGWVLTHIEGEPFANLGVSTTDRYWVVGNTGQPMVFSAWLEIEKFTTSVGNCTDNPPCAAGIVGAALSEPGGSWVACPGQACVTLTHRPYEIFPLKVETSGIVVGEILYATAHIKARLRFSGLPPGAYVASCSGYISDATVPVQLSLVRSSAENGIARLVWYSPDNSVPRATVYRGNANGEWSRLGEAVADGSGYLVFEDDSVLPGRRYGYRLGVLDEGEERMFGETWLDVPAAMRLALDDAAPNPAAGPIRLSFTLPSASPAALELFDLGGRRLYARDVTSLGHGHHSLVLEESGALPPGVYMLRLSQGGAFVTKRVAKVR